MKLTRVQKLGITSLINDQINDATNEETERAWWDVLVSWNLALEVTSIAAKPAVHKVEGTGGVELDGVPLSADYRYWSDYPEEGLILAIRAGEVDIMPLLSRHTVERIARQLGFTETNN